MLRTITCLFLVVTLTAGCAFRMGDMQLATTKNVALNPEPLRSGVEGKDCSYWLLGLIPLGSIQPNLEEAMDRAMEKVPEGNIMTNVAMYQEPIFAFLVNINCLRVKGDIGVLR